MAALRFSQHFLHRACSDVEIAYMLSLVKDVASSICFFYGPLSLVHIIFVRFNDFC